MGLFSKKNKALSANFSFVDGVEGFTKGLLVNITADDSNGKLVIKGKFSNTPEVNLKYEQITGITCTTEKEIIEKSKSVVGRAAIGGVLLGPLGAIVGGMSGVGNKQQKKTSYYMIINYKSRDGETKVLSFEVTETIGSWDKLISHVRNKINMGSREESIYI